MSGWGLLPLQRHDPGAAGRAPGRRRRGVGRGPQAGLGEVGGVREAGGVTPDDPDPGPALAPGDELLHLGVVEAGRRDCVDLRRRPRRSRPRDAGPSAVCVGVPILRSSRLLRRLSIVGRCPCALVCPLPSNSWSPRSDTALALKTGDVPVLATPRVVTLAEEATVQAVEGELDGRHHERGVPRAARPPRAHRGRRARAGGGDARGHRGSAPELPGVGQRRPRPRRRGTHHPA